MHRRSNAAGIYEMTSSPPPTFADVVAFLEFDSEMLAPRFRSAEHAMALIVRAARIAPEVLIQTFAPGHEVIRAARAKRNAPETREAGWQP